MSTRREWYEGASCPTLRPLLDLDFEHVLVTHGPPVIGGGRERLRRRRWTRRPGACAPGERGRGLRPACGRACRVGAAGILIGVSFGVLARPVMGPVAPIVMSALLFAGSAQFGALAVLAAGGGALPAIAAGILLNARFLPMGIASRPSLPGSRAAAGRRRARPWWTPRGRSPTRATGASTAIFWSARRFRSTRPGCSAPRSGCALGDAIGDPAKLGLDALFPPSSSLCWCRSWTAGRRWRWRWAARGGAGAHSRSRRRGARARRLSRRADGAEARMTDVWITIGVLAVRHGVIKAAGPVAVGGRELSPPAIRVISLLAPAVLPRRGRGHVRPRPRPDARRPRDRSRGRRRRDRAPRVAVLVVSGRRGLGRGRPGRWGCPRAGLRELPGPRDAREHARAGPLRPPQRHGVVGEEAEARVVARRPTRSCPRASSGNSRARAPGRSRIAPRRARRWETR